MSCPAGRAFQSVPDELDETWMHGVLVGGLASPHCDVELARSYVSAAVKLIESALASRDAWFVTFPILYLYRHALELYLKAILRPSRLNHDLRALLGGLEAILSEYTCRSIPDHLKDDLLVLAQVDPDAQGFRYTDTRAGEKRVLPGEYWVPLRDLHRFANESFDFLDSVAQDVRAHRGTRASPIDGGRIAR